MLRPVRLVLAAVAAATVLLGAPTAALAAEPTPKVLSTVGHDVSRPQCIGTGTLVLPTEQAFGIVGVNAGVANTTNPCLDSELAWASASTGATRQPGVAVYVNTANPGLAASWWPAANRSLLGTPVDPPSGVCKHRAGRACAYVYGYSLAEQDLLRPALGMPTGTIWYLDVEEANTWSTDVVANRAVLEGMTAAFAAAGARVGLYANRTDWHRFLGSVPRSSSLYRLPTWLAGAITPGGAAENCTHAPLTGGGRITLTQFLPVDATVDSNLSCGTLAATPRPSIHGTTRAGARLTAKAGTWTSGVHLAYQWRRNGRPIAGADHRQYTVRRADRGAVLTVRVIGTRSGSARAVETSAGRRIHR
jgi:hypothetical protein